ncbi:MAG: hypothetical protein JSW00_05940 [Thermoplasmata archaeon]|nr:MAG: hypothetical protein JSW00_05940 [Thermoplasmata archaeon]
MSITYTILIIAGVFVTLIGLAAFLNPNIARWINAPGGPRLKAIIAMIIGIIIIIAGLVLQLQA